MGVEVRPGPASEGLYTEGGPALSLEERGDGGRILRLTGDRLEGGGGPYLGLLRGGDKPTLFWREEDETGGGPRPRCAPVEFV